NNQGYKSIVSDNVFVNFLTPMVTGRAVSQAEMRKNREPFEDPKSREIIWRWVNEIPIEGQPAKVAETVDGYHAWLTETDLPKLLLYVSPGMILTADSVRWMKANLTNITAINVGSGLHYPHETNPFVVAEELARWYSGIPRRGMPDC